MVSINPGGIACGSAAQYFVGDFDGTRFTADDDGSYTPPQGVVVQDFESSYGGWTTTGSAFGTASTTGALPGQLPVSGFEGTGYADSFHGGDGSTGTLPDQQQVSSWQRGGLVNTFLWGDATARTLTSPSSPFPRRT